MRYKTRATVFQNTQASNYLKTIYSGLTERRKTFKKALGRLCYFIAFIAMQNGAISVDIMFYFIFSLNISWLIHIFLSNSKKSQKAFDI